MRAYELMVIISGQLDENAAHGYVKTISNSVAQVGGSVHGNPDWWGRRRLAYPIKKQDDGFYAVFNIQAPATPGSVNFQWGMVRSDNTAFGVTPCWFGCSPVNMVT